MKFTASPWLCGVALLGALSAVPSVVAQAPAGKGEAALRQGAAANQAVCLLFYRDWDSAAATAAQTVQAFTGKHADRVTGTAVSITDPAELPIVARFGVSRAPMPLVVVVYPNGAVTGSFVQKITEAELTRSLVTPTQAACMKGLQQNQVVLLCVQSSPQQGVPQGVRDFQADPHFAKRTQVVTVQTGDPGEANFLRQLNIAPQTPTPVTVFMAPPGVMVGQFPPTATSADLARALTAAGKCCDDPNCKHHHH